MKPALLLPLAALLLTGQAQPPAAPPADPAEQLDYEEDESTRRMTVPVDVAGQGPFDFIVDTGSERTVVSRELAERLALPPGQAVRLHSTTDVRSVVTARVPALRIGNRAMAPFEAPLLREVHLGAAGLIGVDALHRQQVRFDFVSQTLTITPSRSRHRVTRPEPQGDEIVVTARSRLGRLVVADAEVNGQRVQAIIDTGAEVSLGNMALQRALLRRERLGQPVPGTLMSVTGMEMPTELRRTDRIRVGGMNLSNLSIAFADAPLFRTLGLGDRPALLLGMDAMRLFRTVTIDFERRVVRFEAPLSLDPRPAIRMAAALPANPIWPQPAS